MRSFTTRTEITKGWSDDKKYCVTVENGTRYFLRVSPRAQYEEKQQEFELMRRVFALGVPTPQPLEFGLCAEGVYSLQEWIDGDDAEDVIGQFSETEQYMYGLAAGRALQKIHSIPAPENAEPWETRFNRKIDRKIQLYTACGLRYAEDEPFFTYLRENRSLLKDRPQTLQHGDFHIGNMMLDRTGKLWIIDFNRRDYGDPWEEFNRIVWAAQKSPNFASGMVDGYFDGDVPMDFWRLLALYISSNTLGSLPWAIPFGEKKINVMRAQAREILQWYDHMRTVVPRWYRPQYRKRRDDI